MSLFQACLGNPHLSHFVFLGVLKPVRKVKGMEECNTPGDPFPSCYEGSSCVQILLDQEAVGQHLDGDTRLYGSTHFSFLLPC